VSQLLDGIKYDRKGGITGGSHFQSDSTIYGVIQSLVSVEEYKKKAGHVPLEFTEYLKDFIPESHSHYFSLSSTGNE
jgi:hypothetical protein